MKIQLPDFSKGCVLVVGDVMLDRYWYGPVSRISPEAPVPVVRVEQTEERPGGAGNVALNVASLGASVRLVGLVGNDEAAGTLETQCRAAGVSTYFLRAEGISTVIKLRVLSRHQQLLRCDFEPNTAQSLEAFSVMNAMGEALSGVKVAVLSDYAKGTLHRIEAMITYLYEKNIPVFVDPKTSDFSVYRGATVVTPNLKEFEAVVGKCATEKELVEKGHALMAEHQFKALLITRGAEGMTLLTEHKGVVHLPARAHDVFDVTGAGDTVIAVMAASFASGASLEEATAIANMAAGIVVTKLGAANVSVPELQLALLDKRSIESGCVNEAQLLLAVRDARKRGERIVMTNGCFDILHAGHVTYLQQAKALGDRLIVAVNADESVTRLKGKGRPINSCEHREQVLASLASVDWVVPFSEETPARLIGEVLPDVLVKGGDYKPHEIAGGDAVIKNGGVVKILSFVDGLSTTKTIDKLKNL